MGLSYKNAGVDVEAGYQAVALMKKHVDATSSAKVLSGIGGFGGLFSIKEAKEMEDPVLCSGTDGVGTKLKIAFLMDKHDTIGIDCVAMCVNDIICMGAKPLFFLDYIACGKNVPEKIEQIVKGISDGCRMSDCAIVGGETAEMPGFYPEDEYDLAGFCVGIVDRPKIIDGSSIKPGDTLIGIKSSGIHSNGYSLVRSIVRPNAERVQEFVKSLDATMGEALLAPTKIYVKPILKLIEDVEVRGIVNITGGGFYENIPRMFPAGVGAQVSAKNWVIPPLFGLLQEVGNVSNEDMFGTFNMGIGMVVATAPENAERAMASLKESGEEAVVIGEVISGSGVSVCFE